MKGMDLRDWRRVKESSEEGGPIGVHSHAWIFRLPREDYLRYIKEEVISNIWEEELKDSIPLPDEVTIFRDMREWEDMFELVQDIIWFNDWIAFLKSNMIKKSF
mgnify:CR=1 FL=1